MTAMIRQAHLQPPIAEMNISGHIIAKKAKQTNERIANHSRSNVPDMHGLGDVWTTKINHELFGICAAAPPPARASSPM